MTILNTIYLNNTNTYYLNTSIWPTQTSGDIKNKHYICNLTIILMSNKIFINKIDLKYFLGYQDDNFRPLHKKIPKMPGCRTFVDKINYREFLIDYDDILHGWLRFRQIHILFFSNVFSVILLQLSRNALL